jgi:hypothetical protein
MGQQVPGLTDSLMKRTLFDLQQTEKPNDPAVHRSLYESSGFSTERGNYDGYVAENSLYTKASFHPWIFAGVLSSGLAMAYFLRKGADINSSK